MSSPALGEIWLADLDPSFGTEMGKRRPVYVLQDSALTASGHSSVIVLPITTDVDPRSITKSAVLPVSRRTGIVLASQIVIDQPRAIDRRRLVRRLGEYTDVLTDIRDRLLMILGLE